MRRDAVAALHELVVRGAGAELDRRVQDAGDAPGEADDLGRGGDAGAVDRLADQRAERALHLGTA
jgi:hypothetical protein